MSTELEILIQLKTQLVNFLDELIETFPSEPDFVIFRIFLKDQIPMIVVMNYIVNKLCPLEESIKKKSEDVFTKNNILFENFDDRKVEKVNHFKRLWLSGTLDDQDKDVLWDWISSFVFLGKKFKELKGKEGKESKEN